MSRTPVTPLAMKSGRIMSRPPGNQFPKAVCTCMSHRPGIRYLPVASITRAPLGMWNPFELETEMMRLPCTTTVVSGCTEEVAGLMTVACAITSGATGVVCAHKETATTLYRVRANNEVRRDRMLERVLRPGSLQALL